jgi:hypothetical protein
MLSAPSKIKTAISFLSPTQNKPEGKHVLTVDQISRIIAILKTLSEADAVIRFKDCRSDVYDAPQLLTWDSATWFELLADREAADVLTSETRESRRLLRSLRAFSQWRGQAETDELMRCLRSIN